MSDLYFLTAGNLGDVTISVFELLNNMHEQRRLEGIIVDALVQKYLVKRARQMGLAATPEDREKILSILPKGGRVPDANAIEREILVAKLKEHVTREQVQKRFQSDPSRYDRLHIRHLVVADEGLANHLREQLNDPNTNFAELAQQHSIHEPSRASGGDMGVSLRHLLPPRVGQSVVEAKDGQVIGPIKLENAFSLLKVEKVIPAEWNPQLGATMAEGAFDHWLKSQLRETRMDFPLLARLQAETASDDEPSDQIRV